MQDIAQNDTRRWLTVSAACKLLEVNEATLRQWADGGLIRVFRTPGGHRRFLRGDVEAMAQRGMREAPGPDSANGANREDAALRRIRRRLHHTDVAQQPWFTGIDDETKGRMRLFGRRLLGLFAGPQGEHRRRADLLAEARLAGEEYGQEMARIGLAQRHAVEAYVFFRSALLDAAPAQQIKHLSKALDEVLLGITAGYDRQGAGGKPA